jgi:5-methylcytosine-specific restriction endonuclease McrA
MTHDDTTQLHIRLATPVARALSSLAQHRGQSRNEVIASILTVALRGYYKEYLQSDAWKAKRKAVLIRDQLRCQLCGHEKNLHVHHVTYDRIYNEDLEDLITLCSDCHSTLHGKTK